MELVSTLSSHSWVEVGKRNTKIIVPNVTQIRPFSTAGTQYFIVQRQDLEPIMIENVWRMQVVRRDAGSVEFSYPNNQQYPRTSVIDKNTRSVSTDTVSEFQAELNPVEMFIAECDFSDRTDELRSRLEASTTDRPSVIQDFITKTISDLNKQISKYVSSFGEGNPAKFKKELMDAWANYARPYSREIALKAAEVMKVENATFAAWSGPQGTGKGTNIRAMNVLAKAIAQLQSNTIPQWMMEWKKSYVGNSAEIVLGTGGMFNQPAPGSEYEEMFSGLDSLSGDLVRGGELVADEFVCVFTELMTALRFTQGATRIQYDLWPRTTTQAQHVQELADALTSNGVAVQQELFDLRLLTPEQIALIEADIDAYIEAAVDVGKSLKSALKQEPLRSSLATSDAIAVAKPLDLENMYERDLAMVNNLLDELTDNSEHATTVVAEVRNSLERMVGRAFKAIRTGGRPRGDENVAGGLNRLGSYFRDTMEFMLRSGQSRRISSLQSPDKVVTDILLALLPDSLDRSDVHVQVLTEYAGTIATRIVNNPSFDDKQIIASVMVGLTNEMNSLAVEA